MTSIPPWLKKLILLKKLNISKEKYHSSNLWCLIEVGWNSWMGWKNPQNLISPGVGMNGGAEKFPQI